MGSGGGLTCYMDEGYPVFEYNFMIVQRFIAKSEKKLSAGKHTIVVDTTLTAPRPGSPADIVLTVDGQEVARTTAAMTVPAALPRARASMSVSIWDPPFHVITSHSVPSASTARSKRCVWF